MVNKKKREEHGLKRINGVLHRVVPIADEAGKIIHYAVKPLMVELHLRDVMQIIVGAVILAIPVGFTQEVWDLSHTLPGINVFLIAIFSLSFIAVFVFYNFYRNHIKGFEFDYVKRVLVIYFLSLLVVAVLMTMIGQADWVADAKAAIKLIVIVAFPASMSATLSDTIK